MCNILDVHRTFSNCIHIVDTCFDWLFVSIDCFDLLFVSIDCLICLNTSGYSQLLFEYTVVDTFFEVQRRSLSFFAIKNNNILFVLWLCLAAPPPMHSHIQKKSTTHRQGGWHVLLLAELVPPRSNQGHLWVFERAVDPRMHVLCLFEHHMWYQSVRIVVWFCRTQQFEHPDKVKLPHCQNFDFLRLDLFLPSSNEGHMSGCSFWGVEQACLPRCVWWCWFDYVGDVICILAMLFIFSYVASRH